MTCQLCPSALCYDCFPPNFRRVMPEPRFWADLQKKGWNVTPQKIIFFNCNSCLALSEQNKRQLMQKEDLEAQADARKAQALEERRGYADRKRKRDSEEARRRLRQVMAEHEKAALQRAMGEARERVRENLDSLWSMKIFEHAKAKRAIFASAVPCVNCGFPGHRFSQCPMPKERLSALPTTTAATVVPQPGTPNADEAADGDGSNNAAEAVEGGQTKLKTKYHKRFCSICKSSGHTRIQCPQLSPEQRREYENRIELLKQLSSLVLEAKPFCQSLLSASAQNTDADIQACVRSAIHKVLEPLSLGHLIIEPPAPLPGPAKKSVLGKLANGIKKVLPQLSKTLKPKFAQRAKIAPKAKAKASLKGIGLNGTAKPKSALPTNAAPQMLLTISDGVAAGWRLMASMDAAGLLMVKYKSPADTVFHKAAVAFFTVDKKVQMALKREKDHMVAEMKGRLGEQQLETASDGLEERPAKTRRKIEPQLQVQSEGAGEMHPQGQNGAAVAAGDSHIHEFRYGPAIDWVLRVKVTNAGVLSYTYRRPNGKRWELASEAFPDPQDPAWQQVLSTREFVASDIRSRLIAPMPGIRAVPSKRSASDLAASELSTASQAIRPFGRGRPRPNAPGRPTGELTPPISPAPRTPSPPGSSTPPRHQAERLAAERSPSVHVIERSPLAKEVIE